MTMTSQDLFRAKQFQSQNRQSRGQTYSAPSYSNYQQQQQQDEFNQYYDLGKNFAQRDYNLTHDGMYHGTDISADREALSKSLGKKTSDKDLFFNKVNPSEMNAQDQAYYFDKVQPRQMQAMQASKPAASEMYGQGSFADSLQAQYGADAIDPKFLVQQGEGPLTNAAAQSAATTATNSALANGGTLANLTNAGANSIGVGTMGSSVVADTLASMGLEDAAITLAPETVSSIGSLGTIGTDIGISAGADASAAASTAASGGASLGSVAGPLAIAGLVGWDLSRGRDDSLIRSTLHKWFNW